MLRNLLKQQRGITLIELLASLSLFSIVILLSSSLIIQIVNNEELSSTRIASSQQVNLMISSLRGQYNEQEPFTICKQETGLSFPGYTMENGGLSQFTLKNNGNVLTEKDPIHTCIQINPEVPLEISFIAGGMDHNFAVETTLSNKRPLELVLNLPVTIPEEPSITITGNEELTDYIIEAYIRERTKCVYQDNTQFSDVEFNPLFERIIFWIIPIRVSCDDNTHQVVGNAWFAGNITMPELSVLVIEENLFINQKDITITFSKDSSINIKGDTSINGELNFIGHESNPELNIEGNAVFEQDIILKNTEALTLNVGGDVTFNGDLYIEDSGPITFHFGQNVIINGNIYIKTATKSTTSVTINGNPTVNGKFLVDNSVFGNSTITINGNAQFQESIELTTKIIGNTVLQINGNSVFNGNIIVKKVPFISNAIINISGTVQCGGNDTVTNIITETTYCTE